MKIKGVLISLDLHERDRFVDIVARTSKLPEVLGYKIGALAALSLGLAECVAIVKSFSSKLIVYDHQKAGNDIPDITRRLVEFVASAGVRAVILFPFAGVHTLRSGIEAAVKYNIRPIVGALMTHPGFLSDEGGFLESETVDRIYKSAASQNVRDFVIPANQPDRAAQIVRILSKQTPSSTFWTPGIGRQGGSLESMGLSLMPDAQVVPIIGSSIYTADDPAESLRSILADWRIK